MKAEMTKTSDRRWYVVHTKPNQEERATANLLAWGVETLFPRFRGTRRISPTRYRSMPLFPGYLFAKFDLADSHAKVRMTRGVHGVVGFGEFATPVEDTIMDLIRRRIDENGFVRDTPLRPGDAVEVVAGPLRCLNGVFERELEGKDRVMILLGTMGCPMRLQVAKADIRKREGQVAV
jgi:transcriptional antiterminator RfaH